MEENIVRITAFYLLISDDTEEKMKHKLFIEIFIKKTKVPEKVINEHYFISNGRRWKSEIKDLMMQIRQNYENIYKTIKNIYDGRDS